MPRTSKQRTQPEWDAKPAEQRCSDERPAPLTGAELREQYLESFGLAAGEGDLDALTSFMIQMHRVRRLAALWAEQNAAGKISESKAAELLRGFSEEEPMLPDGLQAWSARLTARLEQGKAAPKVVPEEVQDLQVEYQGERAAWQRRRNLHMWRQHQLLPIERYDEAAAASTTSWFKIDRDAPEWMLEVFGASATPRTNGDVGYLRSFSMQPAQTIDRALRGPSGWAYAEDAPPTFKDPRSSFVVEYYQEGVHVDARNFTHAPWRDERTPSIKVYPDHFHDYGDPERHGDLLDWLEQAEGMKKGEAREEAGRIVGSGEMKRPPSRGARLKRLTPPPTVTDESEQGVAPWIEEFVDQAHEALVRGESEAARRAWPT